MHITSKKILDKFNKLKEKGIKTLPDFNNIQIRLPSLNRNTFLKDDAFKVPNCDTTSGKIITYTIHSFQSLLDEKVPASKILAIIENHLVAHSHKEIKKKIRENYIRNLPFLNQEDIIKHTPIKLKDKLRLINPKIINEQSHIIERFLSIKETVYLRSRIARNDINCVFDFQDLYISITDNKSNPFIFNYSVFKSPLKNKKLKDFLF